MKHPTMWASVRLTFEQFHRWPEAPNEIFFLRNLHRHKFFLQVDIEQFNNDRDIEYLIFSKQVKQLSEEYDWKEHTSCEMFSTSLKTELHKKYQNRKIRVSLYEDNENGCIIE